MTKHQHIMEGNKRSDTFLRIGMLMLIIPFVTFISLLIIAGIAYGLGATEWTIKKIFIILGTLYLSSAITLIITGIAIRK